LCYYLLLFFSETIIMLLTYFKYFIWVHNFMSRFHAFKKHLVAYFCLLDSILQYYINFKRSSGKRHNDYAGLTISDSEIDDLFGQSKEQCETVFQTSSRDKINNLQKNIAAIETDFAQNGKNNRLYNLKSIFQLTDSHIIVLIIALAPELSGKYEKIYAYIQDDITRKLPTVELACTLLDLLNCSELSHDIFHNFSPLIHYNLLQIFPDTSREYTPFSSRYIKVDERIVRYILGNDGIDETMCSFAVLKEPQVKIDELGLDPKGYENITVAQKSYKEGKSQVIYLEGPSQVDKLGVAEALCTVQGRKMIIVNRDPFQDGGDYTVAVKNVVREALILHAAIYWDAWIQKYIEDQSIIIKLIIATVESFGVVTFIQGELPWEAGSLVKTGTFERIVLGLPTESSQIELWKRELNGYLLKEDEKILAHVPSTFRLNRHQIIDAAITAQRLTRRRSSENPKVSYQDICTACRIHSSAAMGRMAHKVIPKYRWEDIVLPEEKIAQLRDICNSIRYRSVVFSDWGFEQKISLGKGISALFSGVSGTGKTMAAEIIANTLQVDLYKIDLSSVVSKYIGETEKNLSRIFDEAEHNNAILFFDEADAIMGKRSEVKDAHDRYSNIEVAYLLQRMEEYSGVSILATNLRKNIDEAFIRRIRYVVEFPFPNEVQRRIIWQKTFPKQAPLSENIDWDFLSKKVKLSGGSIKNIVINAAYLAAVEHTNISMQHIMVMAKREYLKAGMDFLEADFKPYFALIEDWLPDHISEVKTSFNDIKGALV
jgi:ATP-dependent 26S proteasome regulatory subunit